MPRNQIDRANAAHRIVAAIDRYLDARADWEASDPIADGAGVTAEASDRRHVTRRELVGAIETLVPDTLAGDR